MHLLKTRLSYNEVIDSNLYINENTLRQFLHQSIFSKMQQKYSKFVALISKSICREMSSCTKIYFCNLKNEVTKSFKTL